MIKKIIGEDKIYLTLDQAQINRKYRVVSVSAGRGLTERIYEMGLLPNTDIVIISRSGGHVIVLVKGVSVALSRGIAKKIFVEELGSTEAVRSP
ncbi:MAG: FeoA family protein [Sulfolobales archaeon]|jgi:Fe2+ transport system protein FeoA